MQVTADTGRLTDREKQTLRLMVRGHDAKSIARHLDLSVHTVNERLREARRKMAVSSSREAARRLLEQEGGDPDILVSTKIGEAADGGGVGQPDGPKDGGGRVNRLARISTGALVMSFALGLLVFALQPPAVTPANGLVVTDAQAPADGLRDAVEASARQWLALVDEGRWDDSWKATGASFRKLNTSQVWATASERVRAPLGAVITRTLISHENLPAPPDGYEVVKFRTSFANKADAIETVTLDREDGGWRVVGVTVG